MGSKIQNTISAQIKNAENEIRASQDWIRMTCLYIYDDDEEQ